MQNLMMHVLDRSKPWALGLAGACLCAFLAPDAAAQTAKVTYDLVNVQVDPGSPGGQTHAMTGTFDWTYTPGDFENGSGVFTEVSIPYFWSDLSDLNVTVETQSIEFTLNGNWHDLGVDVQLKLVQPISPTSPAAVDLVLSQFQVEQGTITTGTFVSGSVVPQPDFTDLCFGDGTGTPCPCGNSADPGRGCANSAGVGAILSASGSPSFGADDLAFAMTAGPGPVPALLFTGTQQANGGLGSAFGDGLLCAGGTIQRLDVRLLDAGGAATWGPGLAAQGGWGASDTRVFQTWYRDVSGSPCGGQFNTTQAIEVTFQP